MTTPPTPPAAVAARVLRVAAVMADDDELDSLDTQTRRWHEGRLRLVVAGEAKRGKSTLVNALLGRAILPTGVTPVTSVATTVTAVGPDGLEGVGVAFLDGRTRSARVEELPDYVTESGNPVNVKGVDHVTVRLASTWLGEYPVELVTRPAQARSSPTTPTRPTPRSTASMPSSSSCRSTRRSPRPNATCSAGWASSPCAPSS